MKEQAARPDRRRRQLLKAASTIAAVGGLGTAPQARSADAGVKVLKYAFEVAETGFDPVQLSDLYSRIVTAHIFENLYEYDHLARPYKVKPCTADGMPDVSDGFRTWTIRLKRGIHFQDDPAFQGRKRELTAADYVYSWKRFYDPRWKAPAFASLNELRILGAATVREAAIKTGRPFDYEADIPGMRALDRYTLQFRFEEPQPRFLYVAAGGDLWGAVAREVVEAYGDAIPAHPVGTGPFRLAEWRRSAKIVLERNTTYREVVYEAEPNADDADGQALLRQFKGRRLPIVDRVEISIIDETQPRWLSFLNRQQDVMYQLPFDFVNIAAPAGKLAPNLARDGVQMYRTLASDVTLTYFNMEDPVVGGYTPERVALRRAIGLASNTEQEIRLFWRGQGVPAQSSLVPNTVGYDPDYRISNSSYDLAAAKALLDTYGYVDRDGDGWREQPDGTPLVLEWATTPEQRARQRDELRRKDMNALGIRVAFKPSKFQENLKNARAGKLQVWSLGRSAASPDGRPALDCGATGHKGGQNLARFSDGKFDAIYQRINTIPDGPEREHLFFEAKRILTAYAPYKFHIHRILTDLAWPWVIGFRRPPYWQAWWQYVDVDPGRQPQAVG